MKTRNGFVSNSSSSSFMLVVSKTLFDNAIKKMHKFYGEFWGYSERNIQPYAGTDMICWWGELSSEDGPTEVKGFKTVKSLPKELQERAFFDKDEGGLFFDERLAVKAINDELVKMGVPTIFRMDGYGA